MFANVRSMRNRHTTTSVDRRRMRGPARRGFSLIEVQVGLVIFGLMLSGLVPYMVMYTKQLRKIQQRYSPQTVYYLAPADDLWSRKLNIAATVTTVDPGSSEIGVPAPMPNEVQILSLTKGIANQQITAQVSIEASL
ncbi:MAG TPA: type II secretion system protein [Pirellulales bacterium]|nr:type II secretion system protein [Pirellulales bacterium]